MNIVKISVKALIISIAMFLLAVIYEKWGKNDQRAGEYTFANVYGKVSNKAVLVLNDGKNTYTLQPENDVWGLKEADSYPIDLQLFNMLTSSISNSVVYNYKTSSEETMEFVPEWNIKIFYDGELTDEVSLKKSRDNRYLAQIGKDKKIYEISGYYDFPHTHSEWLRQPLIVLQPEVIRSIKIGSSFYDRMTGADEFDTTTDAEEKYVENIMQTMQDFRYINALKSKKINPEQVASKAKITTFVGLVYDMTFFEENGKYYVAVEMNTTDLPMRGVKDFIEQNNSLYEGYVFELAPEIFERFLEMQ